MKTIFAILIVASVIGSNLIDNTQSLHPKSFKNFINENILEFNASSSVVDKVATHFLGVSKNYFAYDVDDDYVGEVLVFDDNAGYLIIGQDNYIRKESLDEGLPENIFDSNLTKLYFEANNLFLNKQEALKFRDESFYGKYIDPNNMFHSHLDTTFTTQKTRYLLQELDSPYSTNTNTSQAVYHYKSTWSTYQSGNDCGPLAIANLLWTYKINGVVDLTNGATSSAQLAANLQSYVQYSSDFGMAIWNATSSSNYFSGTGYSLDYTNVANGISSELDYGPIVGFYYSGTILHYALITGKGRSLYQKILGISFYTSWDIVNCWEDVDTNRSDKYWVDNQYIYFGFILKDSNGNMVSL